MDLRTSLEVENVPRILPDHLTPKYRENIEMAPLFKWVMGLGGVEKTEMFRTFNCGFWLVLVVKEEIKDVIIQVYDAVELGTLVKEMK